ncbi:hypothetical protein [Luedemannella helvata]
MDEPLPAWFDFFNSSRLHTFAGYAALTVGDHDAAAEHLTTALNSLGPAGAKQRSVVLANLASTHPDDGDRVATYLHQAIDALNTDWYDAGADRVRTARATLGHSLAGNQLDERLLTLTASPRALPA